MEPDPLQTTPPMGPPTSRTRHRHIAHRDTTGRSPTVRQGRTPRDQKLRRTTPRPVTDAESAYDSRTTRATPSRSATTKIYTPIATQSKSLLPLAERKSQDGKLPSQTSTKASRDDAKLDITPDGGSGGREGRQFAVWNVGHNGRIYLRYVGYKSREHCRITCRDQIVDAV